MPTCSINIQPDRVATETIVQVLQSLKEAFSVASLRLNHSSTAQKRSYPARNIQSFLVLAGSWNLQPLSDECPDAAKPGMQSKTAFVLKNNGFFRPQCFEFFLGSWRTSSRPRLLPEDTHDLPASIDTRGGASNTVPDELSALRQIDAVNGLPASGHPSGRGLNRTSGAIPPDGVPTALRSSVSSAPGGRSAFWGPELRPRPYSPPVSNGLHSSVSGPGLPISNRAVGLPEPEAGWLSSCRPRLQELSRPELKAALLMPYEGSMGRYSCLPL